MLGFESEKDGALMLTALDCICVSAFSSFIFSSFNLDNSRDSCILKMGVKSWGHQLWVFMVFRGFEPLTFRATVPTLRHYATKALPFIGFLHNKYTSKFQLYSRLIPEDKQYYNRKYSMLQYNQINITNKYYLPYNNRGVAREQC